MVRIDGEPLGGAVEYVSPQVAAVLGYRPEEFLADPHCWRRMVHPEDWPGLEEETQRVIASGQPGVRTYRARPKDGAGYRWLEDSLTPQLGPRGDLVRIIGAARDVTDQKHAQAEIERRQHEAESALTRERHQRRVAETLRELALELNAGLDEDGILARTLRLVDRVVPSERARVWRIEGARVRVAAQRRARGPWRPGDERALADLPTLRHIVETGRPLRIDHLQTDPRYIPGTLDDRTPRSYLAAPFAAAGETLGCLTLTRRGQGAFSRDDEDVLAAFAAQAALALHNARLYGAVRERAQRLEGLVQARLAVSSSLEPEEVLRRVVEAAARLAGASAAFLRARERDGWPIRSSWGLLPAEIQESRPRPTAAPLLQAMVRERRPVTIADLEQREGLSNRERWLAAGIRSVAALPLVEGRRVEGALYVCRGQPYRFSAEEISLLGLLADQAGLAIANARLFEQVREGRRRLQHYGRLQVEAQESERRRIAHDLHDEIGQGLTGLRLTLELAQRSADPGRPEQIARAFAAIDDLTERVRELASGLRPPLLDDLGLLPALRWLVERYTRQTGVAVRLRHRGLDRRFAPEVETSAYRIVQEALTNVARHSQAPAAALRVDADAARLLLSVSDRGRGFVVAEVTVAHGGGGLAGMRERTDLVGGALTVRSDPGKGTRITAELPLAGPVERRRAARRV